MEYKLIRSSRRTVGIEIKDDGVTVRAPYRYPKEQIDAFVTAKAPWIEKCLAKLNERKKAAADAEPIPEEKLKAIAEEARRIIPERVAYYAALLGVTYGNITIRCQRTRWGSCSSTGNLSFNCLLMLTPPEVLDSVVVHELCHRIEMNHSRRFYARVLRVFPDYRTCETWLKENGRILLLQAQTR